MLEHWYAKVRRRKNKILKSTNVHKHVLVESKVFQFLNAAGLLGNVSSSFLPLPPLFFCFPGTCPASAARRKKLPTTFYLLAGGGRKLDSIVIDFETGCTDCWVGGRVPLSFSLRTYIFSLRKKGLVMMGARSAVDGDFALLPNRPLNEAIWRIWHPATILIPVRPSVRPLPSLAFFSLPSLSHSVRRSLAATRWYAMMTTGEQGC